jgi:Amidohydrolase
MFAGQRPAAGFRPSGRLTTRQAPVTFARCYRVIAPPCTGSAPFRKSSGKHMACGGVQLPDLPGGSAAANLRCWPVQVFGVERSLSGLTFTVMPPYAPGGQDTWDNLWLQRSAAHPWCGMRNMAAMIGSGVMDRYPSLRVGTLEAGHGWLPFWMARLDEHAETIKAALPELDHRPSDYVTGGRYFQSIEIPEGAKLTNAVIDLIGDHVLMYASDYPHGESHFPESVSLVLDWVMDAERKRKLLWDNAIRFYARAPVR